MVEIQSTYKREKARRGLPRKLSIHQLNISLKSWGYVMLEVTNTSINDYIIICNNMEVIPTATHGTNEPALLVPYLSFQHVNYFTKSGKTPIECCILS